MDHQLPRRQHYQKLSHLGLIGLPLKDLVVSHPLDDGQGKGQGLTGAGLVPGYDVLTRIDGLVGEVLYGEESLDPLALEGTDSALSLDVALGPCFV